MKKIHVLIVPTWYPNGRDKLLGRYHIDFCEALCDDKRMKANLIYVDRQGLSLAKKYVKMKKNFVDDFGNFKLYGRKMLDLSKFGHSLQMRAYVKALLKAYKIYEKEHGKPDVIHGQVAVPGGYAACVLAKKINVPVINTEHSSYFMRYFTGWESKYNQVVMDQAMITCVGEFMIKDYQKQNINAKLLPNTIKCNDFGLEPIKADKPRFNLVSVAALRQGKNFHFTIDAIKKLKDEIPFIHFTIVGDGEEEQFYKSHCEKAGMNDFVSFVGRKTHKEIAEIFRTQDAFVIASDIELFAIPVVEAMSAGLPVVSTRCQGPEVYLTKETGYLCSVNDSDDLALAIKKMYENLDTFNSKRIKEIAKSYDAKTVADMAYNYYMEILKDKG